MYLFPRLKLSLANQKILQWLCVPVLPLVAAIGCWLLANWAITYAGVDPVQNIWGPTPELLTLFLFIAASIFLSLCSLPYALFRILTKGAKNKKQFVKIDLILAMATMVLFLVGGVFGIYAVATNLGQPEADRFFVLNAAIKNTCFMDPKKIGCPHNLTELSYLEPVEFAKATKSAQMTYQYDPADNQYTFIVRYNRSQAVIFDLRLVKTDGIDFREVKIQTWWVGADRVENPPAFPGPWNNLPKWNK